MILKTRSTYWNVAEPKKVDVDELEVTAIEALGMEITDKFAFIRVCARIFEGTMKIYDLRFGNGAERKGIVRFRPLALAAKKSSKRPTSKLQ